jgi:membrane associated rhomboid family serine protease
MRDQWRQFNGFLGRFLTPAVRIILIINVAVFLVMLLFGQIGLVSFIYQALAFRPMYAIGHLWLWQFVTYMFLHDYSGFGYIFFNLLILWFIGPRIESRFGTARFVKFYLAAGIGAALLQTIFTLIFGTWSSRIGMVGASGALYALLTAYAIYWPNDVFLLYFIVPVRAITLVWIMGILAFLFSFNQASPISNAAHLGGILVALIWLKGGNWYRQIRYRRGGPRPYYRGRDF